MVQERPVRRRQSEYVAVGACLALVAGVALVSETSGSSDDEPADDGYAVVCVDDHDTRVDDTACEDADGSGAGGAVGPRWYYIPSGSSAPAVGGRASGGSFGDPASAGFSDVRGGVSPAGEGVVRGGFGGHGGEGAVGG